MHHYPQQLRWVKKWGKTHTHFSFFVLNVVSFPSHTLSCSRLQVAFPSLRPPSPPFRASNPFSARRPVHSRPWRNPSDIWNSDTQITARRGKCNIFIVQMTASWESTFFLFVFLYYYYYYYLQYTFLVTLTACLAVGDKICRHCSSSRPFFFSSFFLFFINKSQ